MEQVSSLIRESQAALEEDTDRCQTIISCYSSSQRCVLKVTKDESRVQYDIISNVDRFRSRDDFSRQARDEWPTENLKSELLSETVMKIFGSEKSAKIKREQLEKKKLKENSKPQSN